LSAIRRHVVGGLLSRPRANLSMAPISEHARALRDGLRGTGV
jgi:hypothetical protein